MHPQVSIPAGVVEGREEHGVLVFRGVPYALPPVGSLRFAPPEPAAPWPGVRPAIQFAPAAPQNGSNTPFLSQFLGLGETGQSEDCLYLNVWTPAADRRRRPVMVWIHGGGFVIGSGASRMHAGGRLARRGGVVVVTINYRLGALGFLNLRSVNENAAANFGLRDQIAALEWVRDNIEQFGGDPDNVTIFGESAGGMSVSTLLATDAAGRLFHRAIAQSGAASNVSPPAQSARVAEVFLRELGHTHGDLDRLRRRPLADLLAAQMRTSLRSRGELGLLPWQPSVDGEVLKRIPLDAVAAGSSAAVDLVVGTNHDEWQLFLLADREGRRLDERTLAKRLEGIVAVAARGNPTARDLALEIYGAGPHTQATPTQRWVQFQSDWIFHRPADELARAQVAAGGRCYLYLFRWTPPMVGAWTGAFHGLEIPFVFGTVRDGIARYLTAFDRSAIELSDVVLQSWAAFARNGLPLHAHLSEWPAYRPGERAALVFDAQVRVETELFAERRPFWDALAA